MIYVKTLQELSESVQINALAHITGGGLIENIPRVLPANARAHIELTSWNRPAIFDWLQEKGNVVDSEMHRTFNCGIGMLVCVAATDAENALAILNKNSESAVLIGKIIERNKDEKAVALV